MLLFKHLIFLVDIFLGGGKGNESLKLKEDNTLLDSCDLFIIILK